MSVIAEMAVKVTADTRSLMSKIQRDGERAGSDFGGKFARGMGGLAKVSVAAGASIGLAAGAVAAFGVKAAAANQQAAVSFDVLLGSAEKSKAFMEELNKRGLPWHVKELAV